VKASTEVPRIERINPMKKIALLLALAPLLASAQASPPPAARPAAPAAQPGAPGPMDPARMEKMHRRMQLALTLGLAETLQLDDAAALKVRGQIEKFTPRRMAAAQQMRDSVQVLRRSAQGEKVPAAEVDAAITRLLDARAQMQAVDRDVVTTVTKDLPAEKRARAVLFLAKFHQRMMQEMRPGGRGPGMGPGMGRGMGPGPHGPGPCGPGMGPGCMGMGPGAVGMNGPEGDWYDDAD
jgi:hypothetical protein